MGGSAGKPILDPIGQVTDSMLQPHVDKFNRLNSTYDHRRQELSGQIDRLTNDSKILARVSAKMIQVLVVMKQENLLVHIPDTFVATFDNHLDNVVGIINGVGSILTVIPELEEVGFALFIIGDIVAIIAVADKIKQYDKASNRLEQELGKLYKVSNQVTSNEAEIRKRFDEVRQLLSTVASTFSLHITPNIEADVDDFLKVINKKNLPFGMIDTALLKIQPGLKKDAFRAKIGQNEDIKMSNKSIGFSEDQLYSLYMCLHHLQSN
jgi:hypothetical protein